MNHSGSALISRGMRRDFPLRIAMATPHKGLSQILSMLGCKKAIIATGYRIDINK